MSKVSEALYTLKNLNFCGICIGGDCDKCNRRIAKEEAIKALEEKLSKNMMEIRKE